jgi:hypothetical protein
MTRKSRGVQGIEALAAEAASAKVDVPDDAGLPLVTGSRVASSL